MDPIIAQVSNIFIPVTDLKKSADWYMRMFGMEMIEFEDRRAGLAFPNRETFIVLWKVEKPQPVHFETGEFKMHYYNFTTFDLSRSYRELAARGAVLSEIDEHPGIRFFETYDPDGNVVNIVETFQDSPYYAHKMKYRNDSKKD
ncbi:VOC family protein [Cohnella suwonensis]|uniref:VOC family protein n=1 Tax=Cohnella suwonensis TaxID=696072 RepID=A0ABW0LQV6_9BACL